MVELLAAIAVGVIAGGLNSHIRHRQSLRNALRNLIPVPLVGFVAAAVILTEVALLVGGIYVLAIDPSAPLRYVIAIFGTGVAVVFSTWVLWLLTTGRGTACGCSYSDGSPNYWSLLRSLVIALFALLFMVPELNSQDIFQRCVLTFAGFSFGMCLFILPEALNWPEVSSAMMQRINTYEHSAETSPQTRIATSKRVQ